MSAVTDLPLTKKGEDNGIKFIRNRPEGIPPRGTPLETSKKVDEATQEVIPSLGDGCSSGDISRPFFRSRKGLSLPSASGDVSQTSWVHLKKTEVPLGENPPENPPSQAHQGWGSWIPFFKK